MNMHIFILIVNIIDVWYVLLLMLAHNVEISLDAEEFQNIYYSNLLFPLINN